MVLPGVMGLDALTARMERLAGNPPQTILLEGGNERQRLSLALYLAMALNCAHSPVPCQACPTCKQIAANEYRELHIFDGRIGNRDDEEKPGGIRALNIENIRMLKTCLGSKPDGAMRVVIFQGMLMASRGGAMNGLLKNLEDPRGHTLFILLAPQREQILKTLVSRSLCITLPWPDSDAKNDEIAKWETALAGFVKGGKDFLEQLAVKGAMDADQAAQLILSCQRILCRVLGCGNGNPDQLEKSLSFLNADWDKAILLSQWLAEAQTMLMANVNPARVLEAFSAKLFCLSQGGLPK